MTKARRAVGKQLVLSGLASSRGHGVLSMLAMCMLSELVMSLNIIHPPWAVGYGVVGMDRSCDRPMIAVPRSCHRSGQVLSQTCHRY